MEEKPSFLKLLADDYDNKCLVPSGFHKHLNGVGVYPSVCSITGPTGGLWYVTITENKNGMLFFDGDWERFVHGNSLDSEDSLLFTYHGDSKFSVKVYDRTECEKDNVFTRRMRNKALKSSKENTVKIATTSVHGGGKRKANGGSKRAKVNVDSIEKPSAGKKRKKRSSGCRHKPTEDDYDDKSIKSSLEEVNMAKIKKGSSSNNRGKYKERIQLDSHESPSLNATMMKSYLSDRRSAACRIPPKFGKAYITHQDRDVVLIPKDGSMSERWSIYYDRPYNRLTRGWRDFAREKKLQVNDVLALQVVKDAPPNTLQFTITRVNATQ